MEYLNALSSQLIFISSLLAGFSIAVVANFLVSDLNTKLSRSVMLASIISACCFLVTVFAMTRLLLMTTDGYTLPFDESDILRNKLIGVLPFYLGVLFLIVMISLAGWTKSRRLGITTTTIGLVSLVLILLTTLY